MIHRGTVIYFSFFLFLFCPCPPEKPAAPGWPNLDRGKKNAQQEEANKHKTPTPTHITSTNLTYQTRSRPRRAARTGVRGLVLQLCQS